MRSVFLLLLSGCAASVGHTGRPISVRGRVVDVETCASTAGCTGLEGMLVSLGSDPSRVSAPTGIDGTYLLTSVPAGYRHDLVVRPMVGASHAPTINPMRVLPDDAGDLFNVELYALPRDPSSLLEGLRGEGIDLVLGGGYLGQVVRVMAGAPVAADNVRVVVAPPQQPIRFVNVLPRFVTGEPILDPPGTDRTGLFGSFVVPAEGAVDPFVVVPMDDTTTFEPIAGPLEPGFVTYAIHRALP